ncbi:MAG: hypothetical protein RIF41_24820 [Polyangiaceae bacterium]
MAPGAQAVEPSDAPTGEATSATTPPAKDHPLRTLMREDFALRFYSLNQAASLGLPFVQAGEEYQRVIASMIFTRYELVGKGQRKGVAVEILLDITVLSAKANLSAFGAIAASAELGYARVSAHLKVRGLSSARIDSALPKPIEADFRVANQRDWLDAFNTIRDLAWADDTQVSPIYLESPHGAAPKPRVLSQMVFRVRALQAIAEGDPLEDALEDLRDDAGPYGRGIVRDFYESFAGLVDPTREPSKVRQAAAQDLVKHLD